MTKNMIESKIFKRDDIYYLQIQVEENGVSFLHETNEETVKADKEHYVGTIYAIMKVFELSIASEREKLKTSEEFILAFINEVGVLMNFQNTDFVFADSERNENGDILPFFKTHDEKRTIKIYFELSDFPNLTALIMKFMNDKKKRLIMMHTKMYPLYLAIENKKDG